MAAIADPFVCVVHRATGARRPFDVPRPRPRSPRNEPDAESGFESVGMLTVKAATAGVTIYTVEKLWRRNRIAAIATMLAVNSAYAAIAAHNYRVATQAKSRQ